MKRKLAFWSALLLLCILVTGCSTGAGEASVDSSEAAEQAASENSIYPLTEETVTLSLYTTAPGGPPCVEDSWGVMQIFRDAGTLMNIDIKWIEPSSRDQLALVIASGDYPDMINGMTDYAGGLGQSYEEEIIIELTELAGQNMPNYSAKVAELGMEKELITDDGYLLQISVLYSRPEKADGIFIRKDWLDSLGLDVPKSIESLSEVLGAFYAEYGCSQTLYFNGSGMVDSQNWVSSAYGFACPNASEATTEHLYIGNDGKVTSGLVQDGYKDYLKQINEWYEAGYISVDFTSFSTDMMAGESEVLAAVTSGNTGVFAKSCNTIPTYFSSTQDESFDLAALGALTLRDEDGSTVNNLYPARTIGMSGIAVTSACKFPELACGWLDYWYSDDGYYALNYGPEGVTWNLNDKGDVVYTEVITNDPEFNANTIIMKYNCQGKLIGVHNVDSNLMVWTDKQIECANTFEKGGGTEGKLPSGISLTTEETTNYSVAFSDISTYASEYLLRFIIGEYDIDEKWQEFQDGMESMGLSNCIAIYQAAYERYLNR